MSVNSARQRWEEALISSLLEMTRARDGDPVALDRLAKISNDPESLQLVVEKISRDPQGKYALDNPFTLGNIDLEKLQTLSPDTLGYCYADHMIRNNLKPLEATKIDNKYQFLGIHVTETHDIWHVITNSNTDILGEIKIEAFSVAQFEVSRFWLALLAKNLLKSTIYDIEVATQYMDALTTGWLMGKTAKPLFGVNWNTLWETPIEKVRKSFNIVKIDHF
ncbi:MAG: hypothetical protein J7647_29690 [Cyanobacteria bacterium SBLK]|nr:hypothetical protein [Cyanobacteria bacterium SBLK]